MAKLNLDSKNHFVGRAEELAFLHNALNQSIENKTSKLIFIRGDYGVGKSALVDHFVEEAKHINPTLVFAKGNCSMETEESGLVPFIQIILALANESAQRKIIKDDVWEFFKKVAPGWLDILTLGLASPIATTLEEGKKFFTVSKATNFSAENIFMQFSNSIFTLAKRQPIMIFVDDIQWADQSSLRLLFHFAHQLEEQDAIQGVIVLVAYRPVEAEYTSTNSSLFREVRANLLRRGAELNVDQGINVSEYISRRYPNHRFSHDTIEQIQRITEGYPLLVDQLLSWWQESNVIMGSTVGGRVEWAFVNTPDLTEIPKSVGVVLEARLRLLSEPLQVILDCASVEGEQFAAQTINGLLELDELRVYRDLSILEKNYQLIKEQGESEVGKIILDFYRFAHRFFREYIYGRISTPEKRVLHKQVGEFMEELYEDKYPVAIQLVRHFRASGQMMKAIEYVKMTARFEQSRYMWTEAQRWWNTGLSWLTSITDGADTSLLKFDLMQNLGDSFFYPSNYVEAQKVYKDAIILGKQLKINPERIAQMYVRLAEICDEEGRSMDSLKFVEQGKTALNSSNDQMGETFLALRIMESLILGRQDKNELAYQIIEEVVDALDRLPQSETLESLRAEAFQVKGIILGYLNKYADAISAYRGALQISKKIQDLSLEMSILGCLAEDYLPLGKPREAEEAAGKALEIAIKIGDIGGEAYAEYCRGLVRLEYGHQQRAIQYFKKAIDLCEISGIEQHYYHSDFALACLGIDNDLAFEEVTKSLILSKGDNWRTAYSTMALAKVEMMRGNWTKAIDCFDQAISLYNESTDRYILAVTKREYAKALLDMGNQEHALKLAQQAIKTFDNLNLPYEVGKVKKNDPKSRLIKLLNCI
jgi:tetratricopeptide (TPR) repeat protein